jgi:threonine aldolase
MIDLRSDTVTKPTPEMRLAMANAEVGDDVWGEDPTVQRLERRVADLLGKPAALFVASGTMGNQIGVRLHCQGGEEFLCDSGCHIYCYEQGAYAQLFGVAAHPVYTSDGVITVDHLEDQVRRDNVHYPLTRLVCLENTHNRGAGRVLPYDGVRAISAWAKSEGLARHLDGARLFNAVVATGISAAEWASHFDTVSVCFSKGMGAPVGSAIVGTEEQIARARRHRKAMGGGMRQVGIIAAGALYALEHNIERLAEDHATARIIGDAVEATPGLALDPPHVDTNIVIFRVEKELGTAAALCERLRERGVLMMAFAPQKARAVTHLEISRSDAEHAAAALRDAATLS